MSKNIVLQAKQGYLITDRIDRKYFSDVDIAEGFLLYAENCSAYFTDSRYYAMAVKKLKGTPFVPVLYQGYNSIKNYLKDHKIKKLFIDFRVTTIKEYQAYRKLKVKIKDGSSMLETARSIKTEEELDNAKRDYVIYKTDFYN